MDKRIKDLTGKLFGRWTVVSLDEESSGKGYGARWHCVCSCGTERSVKSGSLLSGASTSCGCYLREVQKKLHQLPEGEQSFNEVYSRYKSNAKKRGRCFELTEEYFKEVTSHPCYYCGCPPSKINRDRFNSGSYTYNGIDRWDNDEGYTISNSVPCCEDCNRAKLTMTAQAYIELCARVTGNFNG